MQPFLRRASFRCSFVRLNVIFSINSDLFVFYLYLFYYLGWNATNNRIRFNVLCHYCTSSYYGSIANSHACKNSGIGSNPDVFANVDRCQCHCAGRRDHRRWGSGGRGGCRDKRCGAQYDSWRCPCQGNKKDRDKR